MPLLSPYSKRYSILQEPDLGSYQRREAAHGLSNSFPVSSTYKTAILHIGIAVFLLCLLKAELESIWRWGIWNLPNYWYRESLRSFAMDDKPWIPLHRST